MSAGAFLRSFYALDSGEISGVRVQPETVAATFTPGGANAASAGPATLPTRARVSGSRRAYGIFTRGVRIVFTGAVPDGYEANSPIFIPILTPAVFNAIVPDGTGTYLGVAVRVLGKVPERVR